MQAIFLYLFKWFKEHIAMYDKHQLEKQVFVRNCFFHYASNKSCKLLTQTSSQDICSKPFGDIYYSCLRSYFPGIVISAIYCHSQSHISTIYSLYQRPAFERTCSPFLSWGRIHMYTAAMFTFWSFLWAAFPCRWWLLLGYYCYLLGSSPIAAICHRKHTDLPGL